MSTITVTTFTLDRFTDADLERFDEVREEMRDEMDAPSDWDAGTINFDPYV
jgi:hypothetical protein